MTYAAPVREIRFALEEINQIEGLKATGRFEELGGDLLEAVLGEAGRLADEVLAPLYVSGDRDGAKLENGVVYTAGGFKEAYAQYVEGGWQGINFSPDHGGMGLPRAMALAVSEMVNGANMAFGLCPMLTLGAIEALIEHGTDEQRDLYLSKLISGEWTGSMNLTEPHAGSDVGLLKTKAWPDGDGSYRIQGQKIWITWGEHDCAENVIHLVLARLPDAPAGSRGVSLFIVPKFLVNADGSLGERNDLRCIGLEHKMGIHASPTCVMSYGDDQGAIGYLVGGENQGMRAMFTMMNAARLHVGMQGVAMAERAYQTALAFAEDRRQGRTPSGDQPGRIIEHPDVRRMLVTMKAKIEAGRAICFATAVAADYAEHAANEADRAAAKRREDLLTPIAKAWCTDMGVEATSTGVQVHGGMGFVEDAAAAQAYRDVRITPIYEGTNGIQALDLIGRKLVGDQGRGLSELLADVSDTIAALEAADDRELSAIAGRLQTGAQTARAAADWLLDDARTDGDRLAGATAFLQLMGDVVGGWHLAVGALAGAEAARGGGDDAAFAQARIDAARVFAETTLSQAPARLEGVRLGEAVLFATPETLLRA